MSVLLPDGEPIPLVVLVPARADAEPLLALGATAVIDDTDAAIRIVFAFLSRKISPGEISDVKQSFPAAIRHLWSCERESL